MTSSISNTLTKQITSSLGLKGAYSVTLGSLLGMSVWNSFFAGPLAYGALPRQQFGNLQSVLFKYYFKFQSIGSLALLGFWFRNGRTGFKINREKVGGNLGVGLVGLMIATGVLNDLVVGPITTNIMKRRHRLERLEGTKYDEPVVSERMKGLNKEFMIGHSVSALANMGFIGAAALHLLYIAEHTLDV